MSLTPESIRPLKGLAFLRALWPTRTDGGLFIPTEFRPRWCPLGEVMAYTGREDLSYGDWVILEDEGKVVERSYYDVFRVDLRDFKEELSILIPIEYEPHFREVMEWYYRSPSEYRHHWITVRDAATDEVLKFQPPDVLEFSLDFAPNPTYKLEYIQTRMLSLWTGEAFELFYIIDDRRILAILSKD